MLSLLLWAMGSAVSEVYRQLRKGLLPLMEDQRLRVLDPRCGAGTLSGLTLRLAGKGLHALTNELFCCCW